MSCSLCIVSFTQGDDDADAVNVDPAPEENDLENRSLLNRADSVSRVSQISVMSDAS